MSLRHTLFLTATAGFGLVAGCWNGAAAEGLPCTDSSQCGRGQECIDRACGGVVDDTLCGNGVIDGDEECDDGEENTNEGSCKFDCTNQVCGDGFTGPNESCDDGNTATGDGCNAECILESCGDGKMDPGEECDEGDDNSNTGNCTEACLLPECGDGFTQPMEDCDDEGESASCNDDCTAATCGDMKVNASAGEECDNDSPAADDIECMSSCTAPLLWDDMEEGTPMVAWSHEKVDGGMAVTDTWAVTGRLANGDKAWDSGPPAPNAGQMGQGGEGSIRLLTPDLDLTDYDGEELELRIESAWEFLDCGKPGNAYEAAIVEVSVDGGDFEVIAPKNGYPGMVGTMGNDPMCNPIDGEQAFVLQQSTFAPFEFDLSSYAGSSIQIGFRAIWDCGNCDAVPDNGWFVDDVVVWRK